MDHDKHSTSCRAFSNLLLSRYFSSLILLHPCILPVWMQVYHGHVCVTGGHRRWCQVPWKWNCRRVWNAMWHVGMRHVFRVWSLPVSFKCRFLCSHTFISCFNLHTVCNAYSSKLLSQACMSTAPHSFLVLPVKVNEQHRASERLGGT